MKASDISRGRKTVEEDRRHEGEGKKSSFLKKHAGIVAFFAGWTMMATLDDIFKRR